MKLYDMRYAIGDRPISATASAHDGQYSTRLRFRIVINLSRDKDGRLAAEFLATAQAGCAMRAS